jgi:hypothetical protein
VYARRAARCKPIVSIKAQDGTGRGAANMIEFTAVLFEEKNQKLLHF